MADTAQGGAKFRRVRNICLVVIICFVARLGYVYWREHRFTTQIAAAAARYHLDPSLIRAVIWQESRFDPYAHGSRGELGLMQIREDAAFEWAVAEHVPDFKHEACLDPATNILAASWYLKKTLALYSKADDPLPFALADYNAGRRNVLKWRSGRGMTNSREFIKEIGFPGTRAYVNSIERRYSTYKNGAWFDRRDFSLW